jgi:CheY-like chemotaxis protein
MKIPQNLLSGWTVVLIDDQEDSLMVAEIILEAYGATLHTARNGQEGLEKIREVRPDFVISDLSMPTMDGWSMIDAIQRDRALANIPVIALTAFSSSSDRAKAFAMGFYNYLTKPLTVDTFMQDLYKLLIDIPAFATTMNH